MLPMIICLHCLLLIRDFSEGSEMIAEDKAQERMQNV